ncbi:hypothetical protein EVJ58_g6046 [Rhodofomes roseus]|uniref:Uncharacterized protein n=1 Tax=Rhodofomes roseus TaxID=34475 RepID=A0A4Y9Y8Z6_9APHY|nr:hypothetical protein EVJ58_g6046 [Rhodofomes roseus]
MSLAPVMTRPANQRGPMSTLIADRVDHDAPVHVQVSEPTPGPQSPTTYRAMTSLSPSEAHSPRISYASAVASPALPPPSPSSEVNGSPACHCGAANATAGQGAGWTVVSHKKKNKASATPGNQRHTHASHPGGEHHDTLLLDTKESNSEPRKCRRTEDDLGNKDSPVVITRKQNAPAHQTLLDASVLSQGPSALSSSPNCQDSANNLMTSCAHNLETDSTLDIGVLVPDSDIVESLLLHPSLSPRPLRRVANAARRHNARHARISVETSDDDELSDIAEMLPLFPLPPLSIPSGAALSGSPRTPTPHTNRRPATPALLARGHRWSVMSNDDSADGDDSPRPQSTPSLPEVKMMDATHPDTPWPQLSSHCRRHLRRSLHCHARHSASSASSSQSSDNIPEEPPVTFDIDVLDPDIIIPLTGSWRRVQGDNDAWKGRGMAAAQRKSWTALDRRKPVLAVQIPLHGSEEPGVSIRIEAMLDVFRRVLLIPHVFILPGYSAAGFHSMNTEPFWYLARGIPLPTIATLVHTGWLNSSMITLHFDFWCNTNLHLCTMFKLIYRFGAQSKAKYKELVR